MWVENFRVNSFNFGWVDFRENGEKKRVENRRENGWKWGLVGRGVRRENWGLTVFFSDPSKFSFHKIWRKWEKKRGRCVLDKITILHPSANFLFFFFILYFPFFFFLFLLFFFWWIKFLLVCTLHNTFTLVHFVCFYMFYFFFFYPFGICLFYKLKNKFEVSIQIFSNNKYVTFCLYI